MAGRGERREAKWVGRESSAHGQLSQQSGFFEEVALT